MLKHHQKYSNAAILLKRRLNSKLSLGVIRKILNKETQGTQDLPVVFCEIARDRETLIIKTDTDENTAKVLKIIENITTLAEAIEITYRAENTKKVIILGIPTTSTEEEVVKKIHQDFALTTPPTIVRVMKKDQSSTYQLVLEMNYQVAALFLKNPKFLVGFNSCRVLPYRPIIRCTRCQRFGHVEDRCRSREACQYCTKYHTSKFCHIRTQHDKHRCINCIGLEENFPHDASSPKCLTYQYYIHQRNISINKPSPNSM